MNVIKDKSMPHWLEVRIFDGEPDEGSNPLMHRAVLKWDGCIHYDSADREENWHFCGGVWALELEIGFLQELVKIGKEHFAGYPNAGYWR